MIEFTTYFIISQIFVIGAMFFDFLSFQFKERKKLFLMLIISATLISTHYFFLGKITAGIIVSFSVLRFITCYFTKDKRWMYVFILLNTVALIYTYQAWYDFIIYVGICIIIIGNFQSEDKNMRLIMMIGTIFVIAYDVIIFSPMGVVLETSYLISNIIGYYRFYIKAPNTDNNTKDRKLRKKIKRH